MLRNTDSIKGRKYLVVGAARSGIAAARFLLKFGARVVVTEQHTTEELKEAADELISIGAEIDFGKHDKKRFIDADCIVVSPGVPIDIPPLGMAKDAGKEIISEVELAFRHTDGKVIGITGSNGKTTTTALTGAILQDAGYKSRVCGNIGNPFIGELLTYPDTEYFVTELSSFQLETIDRFKPYTATILNITPDHLDRYESIEDYAEAKFNIYKNKESFNVAVLNYDDPVLLKFGRNLKGEVKWFSSSTKVGYGMFTGDGKIWLSDERGIKPITDDDFLILKGRHNLENFMAAALLSISVGVDLDTILISAARFKPIEHRLELVAEINHIEYYNDSKATNIDATIKSLESFSGNLVLILGGRDKGGNFKTLIPYLENKVKYLILTGEAAYKIEKQIGAVVPHVVEERFNDAVDAAISISEEGDIVLLAPACASFDEFKNYEERGRRFKEIVLEKINRFKNG